VDAPRSLVLSGTGIAGVKAQFTFTIDPVESGSRFTVFGDFEGALSCPPASSSLQRWRTSFRSSPKTSLRLWSRPPGTTGQCPMCRAGFDWCSGRRYPSRNVRADS
jgi:hypothetical protein